MVRNATDLYRMNYTLTRPDGKIVPLSGLLALPRSVVSRRLVRFQHGTTTTRTAVPSKPDGTGIAIVFAGNGYALVVPDFPGLGDSLRELEAAGEIAQFSVTFLQQTARRGDKNCLFRPFSFTSPSLASDEITYLLKTSCNVFSQDPQFVKCIHLRPRVYLLGLCNANSNSQ